MKTKQKNTESAQLCCDRLGTASELATCAVCEGHSAHAQCSDKEVGAYVCAGCRQAQGGEEERGTENRQLGLKGPHRGGAELGIWGLRFCSAVQTATFRLFSLKKLIYLWARPIKIAYPIEIHIIEDAKISLFII